MIKRFISHNQRRFIEKNNLLLLTVIAAIVRFTYGFYHEPWMQATDHQAWELVLEQGDFRYDQLIHFPHEGGSILISLFSKLFALFTSYSALAITAFILDFLVRYIQLSITANLFGRATALWFGCWSIFAFPVLIPWATVNFGLHSLSSVFPFLILYLLSKWNDSVKFSLFIGFFLGTAIWFSYSNFILVPIYFIWHFTQRLHWKQFFYALSGLTIILLLHGIVRITFDAGFHLSQPELTSIRGEGIFDQHIHIWEQITTIPTVIVNAALSVPKADMQLPLWRFLFNLIVLFSLSGFFFALKKGKINRIAFLIPILLFVFLAFYVLSPFYYPFDSGNYIAFRHLTYVLPIFTLLILLGLQNIPKLSILIPLIFLAMTSMRSLTLFQVEEIDPQPTIMKTAGWTLGVKFGHDPQVLERIIEKHPKQEKEIVEGIGWGISASLFENLRMPEDKEVIIQRVQQLKNIVHQLPFDRSELHDGIEFSFSDQVLPQLDSTIFTNFIEIKSN